jgi:hypothetical protein
MGVASILGCSLLVFAGLALGAASFQDTAGDDNAAPDVTSVTVSEGADGTISVALAVANFQSMPANSWFNVWFDTDSNQDTGDAGDEVLVRYVESGELELWVWDGAELAERTTTGMTGQFAAGVLTVTAPKSALGNDSTFGVLAVSSRAQELGDTEFIASDYAPDRGRSAYVGPTLAAFPDPGDDEESAPDITAVRVTDTKDGWMSFAISTPNDATMPVDSVMLLVIDSDNRASTGAGGAEFAVTHAVQDVLVERWNPRTRQWARDPAPNRVRARSAGNVVTIDVHRGELDDSARFGFAVSSADINIATDSVVGVDFAPNDGGYFRYTLTNKPALRLVATKAFGTPAQPRAGKPFTVSLPVSRSDTKRPIAAGSVTCNVTADGVRVRATGRVSKGRAQCSLVVPAEASTLRGSLTVRSGGTSVTARFTFRVR